MGSFSKTAKPSLELVTPSVAVIKDSGKNQLKRGSGIGGSFGSQLWSVTARHHVRKDIAKGSKGVMSGGEAGLPRYIHTQEAESN